MTTTGEAEFVRAADLDELEAEGRLLVNRGGHAIALFHHFGQPYFGVLTAVGESAALLPHDRYDENQYIQTTGVVRSTPSYRIDYQTKTLAAGQSLQETYELPNTLPADPIVGLSLLIESPETDLIGNRSVTVVAELSIST